MPRNCDGRTVAGLRNAAKGGCSFVRSCAGETHNSHLFGLQGSLKPQVELMNRFIVHNLLATVVVEYGAQWSLEKAVHIPVVSTYAGPFGEKLVVINKVDEAAQPLEMWSDRIEQFRPVEEEDHHIQVLFRLQARAQLSIATGTLLPSLVFNREAYMACGQDQLANRVVVFCQAGCADKAIVRSHLEIRHPVAGWELAHELEHDSVLSHEMKEAGRILYRVCVAEEIVATTTEVRHSGWCRGVRDCVCRLVKSTAYRIPGFL